MKTMVPISKPPNGLSKVSRGGRPSLEKAGWRMDPDRVLARKIHELAAKPAVPVRQTSYREQDVDFPEDEAKVPIQWPSNQKIVEVSRRLAKIKEMGVRSEASGDYFNSGDLAYQIQEIIRSTGELFQKIQRIKLAQKAS